MQTLNDGTPLNIAIYNAYRKAGLSQNQALAITAEVGRENDFNKNVAFGFHTDPAPNKKGRSITNMGMLSWNRERASALASHLKKRGVYSRGVMQQTQANLNAQAEFSVNEMKSQRYASKLQHFWANPDADPESFAKEIGKKYIVWAYGQNSIRDKKGGRKHFDWKSHHRRRQGYLSGLMGAVSGGNINSNHGITITSPRPWADIVQQYGTTKGDQALDNDGIKITQPRPWADIVREFGTMKGKQASSNVQEPVDTNPMNGVESTQMINNPQSGQLMDALSALRGSDGQPLSQDVVQDMAKTTPTGLQDYQTRQPHPSITSPRPWADIVREFGQDSKNGGMNGNI